jgi:hypothetical protein
VRNLTVKKHNELWDKIFNFSIIDIFDLLIFRIKKRKPTRVKMFIFVVVILIFAIFQWNWFFKCWYQNFFSRFGQLRIKPSGLRTAFQRIFPNHLSYFYFMLHYEKNTNNKSCLFVFNNFWNYLALKLKTFS